MYKFSKDYDLMFTYLLNGNDIFCLVLRKNKIRDVCRCRRKEPGYIIFGVRGIEYGHILNFDIDEKNTELKLFKQECESLKLEWVMP